MKNAVGRDIPDGLLAQTGKDIFRGSFHKDGILYQKAVHKARAQVNPRRSKVKASLREALLSCNLHDGMTFGFHHHFREGDYVVSLVMDAVHELGLKDITICASSLGKAQESIVPYIEDGTITGIESSGVRGKIGEAISTGKLKNLAIMRSHGGRVRAIESGETHIDIAFIGAPTCDPMGNCRPVGGKSDCGVLSYSMVDAQYADYVIAITDTLVPFPNIPASISMVDVDAVVVVDAIGDPQKIATGPAKPTTDMRKLLMARYTTEFLVHTPFYKDGFTYQTGAGGASLASTGYLAEHMRRDGIHMGLALGGITKTMCDMMDEGLIDRIVDAQVFDTGAIENIKAHPDRHIEISTSEYADPFNKGSYVNNLDFVILASLEVDTHFNCNVVVDSSGMITGAQGGHPDTAAGARCTIVVVPLLQSRIPAVRTECTTITTPGETVDVVVTDYGIAINPRRQDLMEAMKDVDLPFCTIEELRDRAYAIAGTPDPVHFKDHIVGIIEARDGSIIDIVRQIDPVVSI
jgi:citrate lyase subunit alpha/citrate CoA-transferase